MTRPDPSTITTEDAKRLADEIARARTDLERLTSHRYLRVHDNLWRLGLFQLYRGLAFGLGSVLGATILVAVIVRVLASIDFIPVIGDWAQQIVNQIEPPPAD